MGNTLAVAAPAEREPHLAGATLDLVLGRALGLGELAERAPELDQEAVSLLPVVEIGEILDDRVKGRQTGRTGGNGGVSMENQIEA